MFLGLLAAIAALAGLAPAGALALTYDTWTLQSSGTTQSLYGVAVSGGETAWAVGASGTIRHTVDGGATWTAQTSGTTQSLRAVVFTGPSTGWAVGGGGVILRTTNGGSTWVKQTSGTTNTLYGVYFSGKSGWVVGARGTIRHTDNSGATWTAQMSGTTQTLNCIAFADGSNGWVGGAKGTQLHTTNAGASWAPVSLARKQTLNAILFTDAANGWEAGSNGTIRHTADGATWSTQTSGTRSQLYGAAFLNGAKGWVVGAGGEILETGNGGSSWTRLRNSPTSQTLSAAACAGPYVYAVGAGGTIAGFIADTIPPVTTAAGLQPDQLTGWRTTSQSVSLSASDVGVGVATTYYTVDGGATQTYKNAFTVSGDGQHPVTYWSVDKDGNTEAVHTGWVNIGNPFAEATGLAPDDHSKWRNTPASITITGGGDNPPFTVSYQVDGGAWVIDAASPVSFSVAGVGQHTVVYYATNKGGAKSLQLTGYVNIETTPPVTTADAVPSGWRNSDIVVPLSATDADSGVAATKYRIDTGAWQIADGAARVPAPADHSMDGVHTVSYHSVDVAGNVEAAKQFVVRIDTRRPVPKAPYRLSVVRNHTLKLKCKVVDKAPCAGRAKLKIVIKNRSGKVVKKLSRSNVKTGVLLTPKFKCKLRRGTYRFFVYATDAAGNTQSKPASNRLTVR